MSKPKILVQLDTDAQASVFDGVVAVDAGVDQLFRHAGVQVSQVRDLVYGAMFTRGGDDLNATALFVGGSDVRAGEAVLAEVQRVFFGPMRVSVMLDSNGANTTAAAAVLAAARHQPLKDAEAVVLAATGPVGSRVVRLLALEGARVQVGSRTLSRADAVCESVRKRTANAQLTPIETGSADVVARALASAQIVIAAGAPGIELASAAARAQSKTLKVAIDLSAVPPVGLAGIEITDSAKSRDGMTCYGAIGVGGTKMKIHKAAIRQLFTAHDQVLDAEEIYRLGKGVAG
jgi:methylenetetrahydrofolate/methylenetetrahydromethanopterin dehydrogenase (NADP+)